MSQIKVQAYIQAQMAHTAQNRRPFAHGHHYTPVTLSPYPHHRRYHHGLRTGTMLPPTTFFEDSFFPNEHMVDGGSQVQHHMPAFSFRPLTPLTHTGSASPMIPQRNEATRFPSIPPPGILEDDVDTSAYFPVGEEELAQAKIEYDVPSPASLDSRSAGPYTPLTDASSSFSDTYIGGHRERSSFAGPHFNEYHVYTSRHGHPMQNLQSMALKQNHLAHWNGQSCSAPASLPAGHLTLLPSPQVPTIATEPQHLHGLPNSYMSAPIPTFARPINTSYVLPTNDLSQSVSSTSTDFSRGFSINELDTSDTEIESSDEEEDDIEDDDTTGTASRQSLQTDGLDTYKKRTDRDGYLLKLRAQGISYKEIKRRGGFREAESTLRGRVRMLTKEKSERVRKPVWTSNDVSLLHRAVDDLSEHRTSNKARNAHKIPWKKVSEYITANGGTYQFAPATCAKKWDDTVSRR